MQPDGPTRGDLCEAVMAALAGDLDADRVIGILEAAARRGAATAVMATLPLLWPSTTNRRLVPKATGWPPVRRPFSRASWPPGRVSARTRAAAGALLRRLLDALPPAELPALDHAIRRLGPPPWMVAVDTGVFVWVAPPRPDEIAEGPARVPQLGLLASHCDGRSREAATQALADSDDVIALPFLLWRTTDWVVPVHLRALLAIRERIVPAYGPAFMRLLPLVARLESVERVDLRPLAANLRALVLREAGAPGLVAALDSGDRRLRRELCRVLDGLPRPPADAIARIRADRDVGVRSWLLGWEERLRVLDPAAAAALRRSLSQDSSPRMRAAALRAMAARRDAGLEERLGDGLFDRAASVRHLARYHLRALRPELDVALAYRTAVRLDARRRKSALVGLGETGAPPDCPLLLSFLGGSSREARLALRSAVRLDPVASRDRLLAALADPRDGVRRDALLLLGRRLPEEDAAALGRLWREAPTPGSRRTIAAAMLRLPPWPALAALLQAVCTDPEGAAGTAAAAVERWRPEHQAYHAPRPPGDALLHELVRLLREARAHLAEGEHARLETILRDPIALDRHGVRGDPNMQADIAKAAQAMLDGSLPFIAGARQILALARRGGLPESDPDLKRLIGIDSETDALPLGKVRRLWAAEALARLQPEHERKERWARRFGEPACRNLIRRFGPMRP